MTVPAGHPAVPLRQLATDGTPGSGAPRGPRPARAKPLTPVCTRHADAAAVATAAPGRAARAGPAVEQAGW